MSDRDHDNVLVEHGVPVSCDDGMDLCLTDAVHRAWTGVLDAIGAGIDAALSESALVDAESSEFVVDELADGFAVSIDETYAGQWPSRETFLTDVAGTVVLASELPGWHGLSSRTRGVAPDGPRLFLDRCLTCGGDPDFQRQTEATCYRTRPVTTTQYADHDVSFVEVVGV